MAPHLQRDIDRLENIQRRATTLVPHLSNLSYEERLKKLKLYKLDERRLRGDMIMVYKMLNGFINVDHTRFFNYKQYSGPRRHNFILENPAPPRLIMRDNTFSRRSIVPWNKLPHYVVNSTSVETFKMNYDKHTFPEFNI